MSHSSINNFGLGTFTNDGGDTSCAMCDSHHQTWACDVCGYENEMSTNSCVCQEAKGTLSSETLVRNIVWVTVEYLPHIIPDLWTLYCFQKIFYVVQGIQTNSKRPCCAKHSIEASIVTPKLCSNCSKKTICLVMSGNLSEICFGDNSSCDSFFLLTPIYQ